jgi:insulysin
LKEWEKPKSNPLLFPPRPNPFIASDFELKGDRSMGSIENSFLISPASIFQNEQVQIWHATDSVFNKPKLFVDLAFITPFVSKSPKNWILTLLFQEILADALSEITYDAEMANLKFEVQRRVWGFSLFVFGYAHKLDALLDHIIQRFSDLVIEGAKFELFKQKVLQDRKNVRMHQPYSHAMSNVRLCLETDFFSHEEEIEQLEISTLLDLAEFSQILFSRMNIDALVFGNATSDTSKLLIQNLVEKIRVKHTFLALPASEVPQPRLVSLSECHEYYFQMKVYNTNDVNSCCYSMYQVSVEDIKMRAILDVIAQIAKEPAFHRLRTVEQLGYIVWSNSSSRRGILSFDITVQSGVHDAMHLDNRIEAFIAELEVFALFVPGLIL